MLRASGTQNCHSWPLALAKSIPLDQWSVWIWTLQTSGTHICHSWPIVYPYTHNISCLTMTPHESLGPYIHSYVSIANVYKPKTMQVIAPMESQDLYFIWKIFGSIKLRSYFAHYPFTTYISYIYIACQHTFIYIHILYIHSMLQHTYLIHTLNMQDECTNKEWSWAFPNPILTLRILQLGLTQQKPSFHEPPCPPSSWALPPRLNGPPIELFNFYIQVLGIPRQIIYILILCN